MIGYADEEFINEEFIQHSTFNIAALPQPFNIAALPQPFNTQHSTFNIAALPQPLNIQHSTFNIKKKWLKKK